MFVTLLKQALKLEIEQMFDRYVSFNSNGTLAKQVILIEVRVPVIRDNLE